MSKADELARKFGDTIKGTVDPRPAPQPAAGGGACSLQARPEGSKAIRSFVEVPIDAIDRDETQPRQDFDSPEAVADLERLALSIAHFGQLTPIRARIDAARGRWIVLVGERRLRACRLAGLATVRVELVEGDLGEAAVLAEQIVENVARRSLEPVEEGRAYLRLMGLHGWTKEELARELGVDATQVYRHTGMAERLAPAVAELIDSGALGATTGVELSKLRDHDEQREVVARIQAEDLSHKEVAAEVKRRRDLKAGKGRGGRKVTERTFKAAGGSKVTVENRRGLDAPTIAAALREATAIVEAEGEPSADAA
jgi:ParB family chromosome partitioning protein